MKSTKEIKPSLISPELNKLIIVHTETYSTFVKFWDIKIIYN